MGGKSRVAPTVWDYLGDCANVIEPFCFSAAFLLARPADHTGRVETLSDINVYVSNFWRATSSDPEAVAQHADSPVNEADLHARHRYLVLSDDAREFRRRMRTDPTYYDARIAGWWCWGACCWIGSGWCDVGVEWEQVPLLRGDAGAAGAGVNSSAGPDKMRSLEGPTEESGGKGKMPRLTGARRGDEYYGGLGVNNELPQKMPVSTLQGGGGDTGTGVNARGPLKEGRPQLADEYDIGRGVNATPRDVGDRHPTLSQPGGLGWGVNANAGTCAQRREWLLDWFHRLRDRLRNVRVCCGDWKRVCSSPSVTTRLGSTGLFLDPPYAHDRDRMHAWLKHLREGDPEPGDGKATNRAAKIYASDDDDTDRMVADVLSYCIDRGDDPKMRIALCGFDGEHDQLEGLGWTVHAWKASGGYGNQGGHRNKNADRERIWFSPHCLDPAEENDKRRPLLSQL